MPRDPAPRREADLPMALRVLEDLLAGHLLIYPAKLCSRHGGKREAWYKCCAMMAANGWLSQAQAGDALAYRAGPKCWAIGDATLNGLDREHDLVIDAIHEVGQSLRAMRRARDEANRRREQAAQPSLPIDPSSDDQIAQRCAICPDTDQTTQGVAS